MPETALSLAGKAARHLTENGIENGRLDAELMLAEVLGISRLQVYTQFDRPIDEQQLERYRSLVRRRLKREPLQYILGHTGFRKLDLRVDRRALIPRPETEILVEHVLRWLGRRGAAAVVLDLGTGSGAIALSLAQEARVHVVATDAAPEALALAAENAQRLGLAERIEFRAGALWQALEPAATFDAIVSNPPYVADSEAAALMPEVRDWEPAQALFAGSDGLSVLRAIVSGAAAFLKPGGLLALEVGATQRAIVRDEMRSAGYTNIRIEKDLAGRERAVLAEVRKG
ncbi:MAG: peptide chain release factor N(5)-glutamine methyltransferase [Longimicrobiales bacterium]